MWEPRRLTTLWVSTACYIIIIVYSLFNDAVGNSDYMVSRDSKVMNLKECALIGGNILKFFLKRLTKKHELTQSKFYVRVEIRIR
jgi:hypothetical protein